MRTHLVEFGSVSEVIRDAVRFGVGDDAATIDARLRSAPRDDSGNPDYFNGYSWARLESAVANPPPALIQAVDAMRERIGDCIIPERRSRRIYSNSETGDELSPLAWAQRNPAGWTEIRSVARPRETLTIGINLGIGWKARTEDLLYRGAAVAALSDVLESAGHAVEIVAFKCTNDVTDRCERVSTRVLVKPSDSPLDIGAVAFALCEVAFYRLALMSANARRCPGTLTENWGGVVSLTPEERAGLDILAERDIRSEETALAWIRQHAAALSTDAIAA
jgi:hypothetical protein